jgi:hypothetical protein
MHHLVNTFNVHWSFSETPAPKPQKRPSCRFGDLPIGAMFRNVMGIEITKVRGDSGKTSGGTIWTLGHGEGVYPITYRKPAWRVQCRDYILDRNMVHTPSAALLLAPWIDFSSSESVDILVVAPR